MPKLLLDVSEGFTVLNQERRECVSQIVEADPPKLCVLQTFVEVTVLQVVYVAGIAFPIAEDPLRSFVQASATPDADFKGTYCACYWAVVG